MPSTADYLVIGAGIVGLATACELKRRRPGTKVILLEKEDRPGRHSSGRNSGVLHSGIYYPPGSLKARVCGQGAVEMAAYCRANGLAVNRIGKVLVPTTIEAAPQLNLLEARGRSNGLSVERWSATDLAAREPEVRSASGEALFVASTSVVDSRQVMERLVGDTLAAGVELRTSGHLDAVDPERRRLIWAGQPISYGHAINTAGLHADTVAHQFGTGRRYTLLPFKGLYWKLDPRSGIVPGHLIYPVPDLRVPFLGVHTTTALNGTIYIGPAAVPALARENYSGLQGVSAGELLRIGGLVAGQFVAGRDGFRRLALQEGSRYAKFRFARAARALLPRLRARDMLACDKVGIRAQMLDRETGRLVTDFLIEAGPHSTHVLNAVSPAFTSAFPFARHLCDVHIAS